VEIPEILKIANKLLPENYVQPTKEETEKWNKFLVGFTQRISVDTKQMRVMGRIRTFRKWLLISLRFLLVPAANLHSLFFFFKALQEIKFWKPLMTWNQS